MRLPPDMPPRVRPRPRRRGRRVVVISILVVVILLLLSLQGIATFYTDYLWYQSVQLPEVWRVILETKLELAAVFMAVMFIGVWASLWFVDRLVPRALLFQPDLDLVRRFQALIGPHVVLVRTVIAAVVAFLVGSSAASQWQNWLLFAHAQAFTLNDPVYNRNYGFFVFRLPFETFVVNWFMVALITVFIVTAIFLYLNGAIRLQGGAGPRIEPVAVAHLSLILGLLAFVKAIGYFYVQRYTLEYSTRGVVEGANYTDIHVQKPALELLAVVAFIVFVMLVFNIYYRSLVVPGVGIGLWALVAIGAGFIYPALVQALKVTPAQSTLEQPYIQSNIQATRYAMGIDHVTAPKQSFPATTDPSTATLSQYDTTINDADLWDPTIANTSFQKLQAGRSFFQLQGLSVDRYSIGGQLTPVVVGVRGLYQSGLPSQSWVNTHLEYTHGYGATISPANTYDSNGAPTFDLANLPPQTTVAGAPSVSRPAVYFGLGSNGYSIVDTSQREIDYTEPNGVNHTSTYAGSGGVPLGSVWTKLAFAVRFHDLNLLISNLVGSKSQIIFVQNVRSMVQKAAPFLQVDANPYPVVNGGQIWWIVDCYTTTSYIPYGQNADTSALPSNSGLAGSYNYVRNSVKVVVNAYTGSMQFYVVDPTDPLIQVWEAAFPGMWQPLSAMNPVLQQHLRYPQDLLTVQSAAYGRYHLTSAAAFYNAANAYELAQTAGTGSPSSPLPTSPNGSIARFTPIYELLQLNGPGTPQFDLVEPFVPFSSGDRLQTLTGFMTAGCDLSDYGQLTFYTSGTADVNGPALVELGDQRQQQDLVCDIAARPARVDGDARHDVAVADQRLAGVGSRRLRLAVGQLLPRAAGRHRRARRSGGDGG